MSEDTSPIEHAMKRARDAAAFRELVGTFCTLLQQAEQSAPISLPVLREALSQAIQTSHQLAAALQNVSGSVAQTEQLEPVTVATERLQRHLDTLQTAFSDQCRRLWVEDANDQWTFKQIEVALSVPLLPGDDVRIRNELRRRYFTRRDPAAPPWKKRNLHSQMHRARPALQQHSYWT